MPVPVNLRGPTIRNAQDNNGLGELGSCEEVSKAQRWRRKDPRLSNISVVGSIHNLRKSITGKSADMQTSNKGRKCVRETSASGGEALCLKCSNGDALLDHIHVGDDCSREAGLSNSQY